MREKLLACLLVIGAVCLCLCLSPEPTGAGATKGKYPVYGVIYGVPDGEAWKAGLPKGKDDQVRYDADYIERAQFVYETGSNQAINKLMLMRALNNATDAGWKVVAATDEQVIIWHPNLEVYDKARK